MKRVPESGRGWGAGGVRAVGLIGLVLLGTFSAGAVARHHSHRDAGDATTGEFDYYLLTLSWSPTYCLTHPDDRPQCDRKGFGFVLHGLWPQYNGGGYPQHCASPQALTADARRFGETIFPSPKLVDHEWSTHGVCSGLDALGYFQAADRARTSIRVPRELDAPAAPLHLTAPQIVASLRAANPTLPGNGLVVACSRGELAEIRICLNRDLSPIDCGRGVRTHCPAEPVEIPASR